MALPGEIPAWRFAPNHGRVATNTTRASPPAPRATIGTDREDLLTNTDRRDSALDAGSRSGPSEFVDCGIRSGATTRGAIGNLNGFPRASQKSLRFFRLVATNVWSGSNAAVAMA